ncbi:hypothetical protein BCL57_003330 [Agromyces flavus]|uniref:Uncharacterized protein n=1 Tax=Agromyces flavus TaxID=589382 RepID=A0A1H1N6K6_9MICO|nr:DUF6264 family protein [Agromyces flavus]MCP2369147.1 hypothetical protein [Agromyces flavus]GGI48628.1 hypothetical protein GCM10010932_33160 [Agromyces flavus]SDR94557.1 hypothetical protein SAMN04489721_0540 [Agromyces flavus]
MSQDEAARNETHAQPADGVAPPRDERPRPRYGEYAPEGWSWQPPADERADAAASAPHPAPPPPAAPAPNAPAPPVPVAPAAQTRSADRFFTILLLALGALGAWNTSVSLQQLPAAIQTVYTQQGVGTYTPQEWLPTLALVGTVFMLALYAAVLGWSIVRFRARKVAFWVPIAGGVVALVATIVLTSIVFITDPTFQSYLEGMSGV